MSCDFELSVGIMAYNEEQNIAPLINAILKQSISPHQLKEIIVVSSGSTDGTNEHVRSLMKRDQRIQLLIQNQREGKASAINLFLSIAKGNIIILESADTIPKACAFTKLIAPFQNPKIGMTGAHPIPINRKNNFIGFTVHFMWTLHHKIALSNPKLGELVAFRRVFDKIPTDTAVDEASIEAIIRQKGLELCYVPEAIVNNKGLENISDFLKQRRRITAGHQHLQNNSNYKVNTSSPIRILSTLFSSSEWGYRQMIWIFGAIILEIVGRVLGNFDYYIKRKNPMIWEIANSTKTRIEND